MAIIIQNEQTGAEIILAEIYEVEGMVTHTYYVTADGKFAMFSKDQRRVPKECIFIGQLIHVGGIAYEVVSKVKKQMNFKMI